LVGRPLVWMIWCNVLVNLIEGGHQNPFKVHWNDINFLFSHTKYNIDVWYDGSMFYYN